LLVDLPWEMGRLLLDVWPDAIDLPLGPESHGGADLADLVRMLQDHGLIMLEAIDTSGKQGTVLRDLVLTHKGRQTLRVRYAGQ